MVKKNDNIFLRLLISQMQAVEYAQRSPLLHQVLYSRKYIPPQEISPTNQFGMLQFLFNRIFEYGC